MTFIQKLHARNVIRRVAQQHGISIAQCRSDMKEAILEAWATTDPLVKDRQIQAVGEGRAPTPEEFIVLLKDFT